MNATGNRPRPKDYIASNVDGTYDAFVGGLGFASCTSLPEACRFIRENTDRQTGAVACFDRHRGEWTSEIDIAEGA